MENLKTKLGVILFSERRSKTARTSVVNELNSKKTYIYFTVASVLILHPCVKVIMHKGKDGLVMEVREIYKISDMIHKAAGWKKENV